MARSNGNGYVPRGLRKNKVLHAKTVLAPFGDRTMTSQHRTIIGPSQAKDRVIRAATLDATLAVAHVRRLNGDMVLSPRQQRKRARLLALAGKVEAERAIAERTKARELAIVNAERGKLSAERSARRAAKLSGMVEAEVRRRDRADGMAWFLGQVEAMVQ